MEWSYLVKIQSTPEVLESFKQLDRPLVDIIDYTPPHKDYGLQRLEDLQDFTNLIPLKRTEFDSHLVQNGAYGWTILNGNYMVRDRYLEPSKAKETDVHELIHTENEHETRQLTRWMLAVQRAPNYYGNPY